MTEILFSGNYAFVVLTLAAFTLANLLQKKTKLVILNPILIGSLLVMLVLTVLDIPNETYQAGNKLLGMLLTPATICLSISFYQQFQALKKHFVAVFTGVLAGSVSCIFFIIYSSRLFGLDTTLMLSLLPKSITTAIGTAISEEIGGIAAITTFGISITGIFGYTCGPALCKFLRIREPIAQGVSFGTGAHVIGTVKATQLNELAGAVSSLSLTLAGLITVIILSFMTQFL